MPLFAFFLFFIFLFFQEALIIFNTKSLAKYLKAIEELKSKVAEDVKLSLEEKSRDVCAKWEVRTCLCVWSSCFQIQPGPVGDQNHPGWSPVCPMSQRRGLTSAGRASHTPRSVGFCLHSANSFWRLESDWKVERGSQGCFSFFFLHSVSGSRVCPCQQVPWIQPLVGAPPAWAPLKPPGEGAGSFVPTLVSGSLYCPIFGFHLLYNQFPAFSSL